MISRVTFFLIAAFWVAMNVLLWRAEYGSHGGEMPVPVKLVWRKILTAPDPSSLSVYQGGEKTGFAEFSTSVEQEMAKLDADKPPPEGLLAKAGYQIRLNGNVGFGDFTNRVKFDGRLQFWPDRTWRELNVRISSHLATVEIRSVATNETVSVNVTSDGLTTERVFTFAELQNPAALLRWLDGNFGGGWLDEFDWPASSQPATDLADAIQWDASRDRLRVGHEFVSVYRLETRVLDHPIVIYASTLGEILRAELPGGVSVSIDEWGKP
jgi:hypothetical protein